VQPGYKLGVVASHAYQGIERGSLNVNKVFHLCSRGMCIGESPLQAVSRDTLRLAVTVNDTSIDETVGVKSEVRAAFEFQVKNAVAQVLAVSPEDIAIDTVSTAASSGTLRRWLQDLKDVVVRFTITINSDTTAALIAKIHELRNTSATTINVSDSASTADTATFTQPMIIAHSQPTTVQCEDGHDPASPLCRVCLNGWMEAGDQMCIECDDESLAWFRVIALAVAIGVGWLLLLLAFTCYQRMAARGAKQEAKSLRWVKPNFVSGGAVPLKIYGKIVISHYQVCGPLLLHPETCGSIQL
jgi:hypothetical protein